MMTEPVKNERKDQECLSSHCITELELYTTLLMYFIFLFIYFLHKQYEQLL